VCVLPGGPHVRFGLGFGFAVAVFLAMELSVNGMPVKFEQWSRALSFFNSSRMSWSTASFA